MTHGEKTRHGIPTETIAVTIGPQGETSPNGPSGGGGGGGGGHLEHGAPDVHSELQHDADAIHTYIMRSGPASIRVARSAVKLQGRKFNRFQRALDYLVMNGRIRRLVGAKNRALLTAESGVASTGSASRIGGVEPRNRSTGSSGSANGTGGGTTAEPVTGTGSALKGNHSPEPVPGTGQAEPVTGSSFDREYRKIEAAVDSEQLSYDDGLLLFSLLVRDGRVANGPEAEFVDRVLEGRLTAAQAVELVER